MVYVVVDNDGNVYGVCDSEWELSIAKDKLKNKYSDVFFDHIECRLNEIEAEGEIL